ncbi:MAG: DMT family transporter [Candidatus Eiseniibacteriota bacterium]
MKGRLCVETVPYIGEIFALAAPFCWSCAVLLFRRTGEVVPPLALNLFKNLLATVLFWATFLALGRHGLPDAGPGERLLLVASGAIGIGISDTFFFMTLNRVGAGLQAIINTSYSPSIILLSVLFLGERLGPVQVVGVVLILGAVLSVTRMRGSGGTVALSRRTLALGVTFGILCTTTQAVSIVMIKPLLERSPLIWANCWRMLGGVAMSVILLRWLPHTGLATLRDVRIWPVMIPGALLGTYVSLVFWLAGMKYTQASTASALNQTATLWTFVLAAILLREPVTWKRLLGLAGGVCGVALVTFG